LVPSLVPISFILIIMIFSWSHEQNISSFHESRLGTAFINIFIKISNVCAIFTNLLIFSWERIFYKVRYSTRAKPTLHHKTFFVINEFSWKLNLWYVRLVIFQHWRVGCEIEVESSPTHSSGRNSIVGDTYCTNN
jgi:hypothetical protein